jgi:hypothetical protein
VRTFDAGFLNSVANHPEIRPWLAGEGEIDLSAIIGSIENYALVSDSGGFLLTPNAPGVYEVHSMFLPGGDALGFMMEAQEWMFTRTACQAITSKVPKSNRAAKGLALKGGLGTIFEREDAELGHCEYVELPIMKWAMRNKGLEAEGERFHALLEQAKLEAGSELPVHPHDPAHERAVGAALLMIERGQPMKGVDFYNRWAMLAGYAPIRLLSTSPVTVDVVDAIVALEDELEVVLCR